MPAEPLLVILIAATVINVGLVIAAAVIFRRRRRETSVGRLRSRIGASPVEATPIEPSLVATPRPPGEFGSPAAAHPAVRMDGEPRARRFDLGVGDGSLEAYDRVVRVVTWAFILATATIVVVSGAWPATEASIFVLLALTGLAILAVHEILPASLLGTARYLVEGSIGLTVATLLIVLTGGAASPFFFAYLLIVAGAALVLTPRATVVVTAIAIGAYLLGVLVDASDLPLGSPLTLVVGANIVALVLLTYVALVLAGEQRRSRDAAIELSTVDSLTGLYNRAYFFAATDREIQRSARSGRGFCLLMMDLDGLKPINDRFGHFQGDRVLRGVGEIISHGVRRIDTAARYGGDEFVVLLPETEPSGALILAEKMRQGVAEMAIETPAARIHTSLSIGVVTFPEDGRTADDLMISADQAMYASKRRGKNRIVGYRPATGSGTHWTNGGTRPGSGGVGASSGVAGGVAGAPPVGAGTAGSRARPV